VELYASQALTEHILGGIVDLADQGRAVSRFAEADLDSADPGEEAHDIETAA